MARLRTKIGRSPDVDEAAKESEVSSLLEKELEKIMPVIRLFESVQNSGAADQK
jgi:hypothetical protein